MKRLIALLTVILFSTLLAHPLSAQVEPPVPPPDIFIPPVWTMEGLEIEYQRVNVTINNQIATTRIDQLFVNTNDWMMEGVYLFPLPAGATVTELTMWVDGQPIESKILRKEEARAIYDEIVRQLRDPALLEYVGQDAIQANVFPIPPLSERRIEIEYQQLLPADNGLLHYIYPQSTNLYTNLPLTTQNIRVEVTSNEAIRAIYSPSHPVGESRDGEFKAVLSYEGSQVVADTDFELYYSVSPEEIGLNLLTYKEEGQDGFFMLLAAPSVEVDQAQIVAKDVILILDTSGSMEGEKLEQAKEAARYFVEALNPQDRFNIVTFSTGVRTYMPELTSAVQPGEYEQFINSLEALGGTNISQALLEAAGQTQTGRPTTIIFMTDGLATEGITDPEQLLNVVEQELPAEIRIFSFGVGDDVDTFILDTLSSEHRGTTSYVRPFEQLDEKLGSFLTKVSTPVLADIQLDFGNMVVEQMYPNQLPDLFAGSQLVLVGRYRSSGPATITLRGDVNGQEEVFIYHDNLFRASGGDEFIPRLWATRAIGNMLEEIRLKGENPELIESIVTLSIRYGIITPYTSYLIEEDDIFSQLGREAIIQEEAGEFAPAPSSGSAAVDEASFTSELKDADTVLNYNPVMAEPSETEAGLVNNNQPVQFVGSKTFVWRDGRWIDTSYDDSQTVQQVGFASDNYFNLLNSAPELGQYFALGEQVLVIYQGVAYEVVPGAGATEIQLPNATVMPEATIVIQSQPTPAAGQTTIAAAPTAVVTPTVSVNTTNPAETPADDNSLWSNLVYVTLAVMVLVAIMLGVTRFRK